MHSRTCLERLSRCSQSMKAAGLDVLLLTKPANMYYLTGDGRLCAYAMVTQTGQVALGVPQTDVEDVKNLAHCDHIVGFENEVGMIHSIAHHFSHFGIKNGTIGLEYTFLTQSMMAMLTHPHAKPAGVVAADCTHVMSELRMRKSDEEVERIAAAARVADAGMTAAVKAAHEGITETQVAGEAEKAMRSAGAEGVWRSYVASGPRTNIAHGVPSARRIGRDELVMIDIHPIVNGYSADICRTICAGRPNADQRAAHDLYVKSQQSAVALAKAGATIEQLEQAQHGPLREAGHAAHIFGPPVHGVGIEFEEAPLPSGHAFFHGEKAPPPLQPNNVIAVGNCGLYTGPWGVRVEDTIVVGRDGPRVLTEYPRGMTKE